MQWLISVNKETTSLEVLNKLNYKVVGDGFSVYSSEPLYTINNNGYNYFFIKSGNLLPILSSKLKANPNNISQLFIEKYIEDGKDAINSFKGNFTILVGNEKGFNLFSDRLGIKKFFYYGDNKTVEYISSDISLIKKITNAKVNFDNIAIFSLTNRFPAGITMFDNIKYSTPAFCVSYFNRKISLNNYWSSINLYSLEKQNSTYKEYAGFFLKIMKQYLDYYQPHNISLTLTGGSDSRILLGSLLHYGYNPKTFTFGDPESGDVNVAKNVAKYLGLIHNNHYEETPTAEWFKELTKLILKKGNSLINYHRAYRLDGLLKEKATNPSSEITIVGHAGGEAIRGLFFDNLIVTNFVKNYTLGKNGNRQQIVDELKKRFVLNEEINLDYVCEFFNNLPYINSEGKKREFLLIFELLIANHLYQDLNLYDEYHQNVLTPFMDIDYLEYLFSTQFSMLYKKNTSKNILNRLTIPELHSNVIREIYPNLTKYKLNNGYSPAEYLNNKYFCAVKKTWRGYFSKNSSSNFSYDSWFLDYIKVNWPKNPSSWLKTIFDLSAAEDNLKSREIGSTEKFWMKYSSIIMLENFSKYY